MTKRKLKKIAIIGMIISAAIWVVLTAALENVGHNGVFVGAVAGLSLGGVPTAFLQFRLCLTDREKWVRWVPAVTALAQIPLILLLYLFGGDIGGLLALMILAFALAPSAGICLGWLAHGKRAALIPLNVIFIAYLVLNGLPFFVRPFELVDAITLLYLLVGVYLCIRPAERSEI